MTVPCPPVVPVCGLADAGEALVDQATETVQDAATAVGNSAFDKFIQTMVDGANWVIEKIMTLWLKAPDPDVTSADSPVRWLDAHLTYVIAACVVATIMWSGIKLALYAQKSDAVNLVEALTRTVLAQVLTGTLVALGLEIADAWSQWILDEADLDLSLKVLAAGNMVAPAFLLVLALFVLLTQFIQLLFMIFRNALVMVLTSTVTLAAATSTTRTGRQAYEKQVSWLVAFILYKPVAALIYAFSFEAASADDLWSQLGGLGLMILSVATLPALQRLIAGPVMSSLGGANAGALAGAAVGAGVALGAMVATGGASAAAGAGSSGAGGFLGGSGTTALAGGAGPEGNPSGAKSADATVPAPSGRPAPGGPDGASSSGDVPAPGDLGGEMTGEGPSGADSAGADTAGSKTGSSSGSGGVVGGESSGPVGAPSPGVGDSGTPYSAAPDTGGSNGSGGAMGRALSAGQRAAGGARRLQSEADSVAGGDGAAGPSGSERGNS